MNLLMDKCPDCHKKSRICWCTHQGPIRLEISIDAIIKSVCMGFKVTVGDIKSKSRKQRIVTARNVAMYLCRCHTKATLSEIGKAFGGKYHATVLHGVNTVERSRDLIQQAKIISDTFIHQRGAQ